MHGLFESRMEIQRLQERCAALASEKKYMQEKIHELAYRLRQAEEQNDYYRMRYEGGRE